MKGLRRIMLLRILLFSAATLLTIVSGFILVRRLDQLSYAAYQSLNKRASMIVLSVYVLYSLWIYRDVVVGRPGVYTAGLLLGVMSGAGVGLLGGATVYGLTGSLVGGLLAFVAVLFYSLWVNTGNMLDALRPVRIGVSRLLTRLTYSTLIVVTVYLLHLQLAGALASLALGYAAGLVLNVSWMRGRIPRSGLGDAVRLIVRVWAPRAKASIYMFLRSLLLSLDVFILLPLAGPGLVAAYFAYRIVSGMVYDAFNSAFSVLHRAGLKGSELSRLLKALRLAMAFPVVVLVYSAVYRVHVAYLVGTRYLWASPALILVNAAALVNLLHSGLTNAVLGFVREESVEEEGRIIGWMSKLFLYPAIFYILATLAAGLLSRLGALDTYRTLLFWLVGALVSRVLDHAVMPLFPSKVRGLSYKAMVREAYVPVGLYIVLALIASLAAPPPGPPVVRFIPEALKLGVGGSEALAIYGLLLLVFDADMRGLMGSVLRAGLRRA